MPLGETAQYLRENNVATPMFGPAWERKIAALGQPTAPNGVPAEQYQRWLNSLPPAIAINAPRWGYEKTMERLAAIKKPAVPGAPAPGTGTPDATTGGAVGVPDILSQPYNPLAGGPAWAPGTGAGGGQAGQALNVISGLLNTNPDTNEWDTASAERATAQGIPGSRLAAAEGSLLRQSEIDKRNELGLRSLEPFLQRQQSTFELIEKGRQAKDLLRLEQEGKMAQLTSEQKARLEEIAAQGANALAQTRLAGEFGLAGRDIESATSRANALLGANTSSMNARLAADTNRYEADKRYPGLNPIVAQAIQDYNLHNYRPGYQSNGTPYGGAPGSGYMYSPGPTTIDDYGDFTDTTTDPLAQLEEDYNY